MPRSEERFAGRMSLSERISYYYGAPGKPLVCVTCGSKELVLAMPPLCATCRRGTPTMITEALVTITRTEANDQAV